MFFPEYLWLLELTASSIQNKGGGTQREPREEQTLGKGSHRWLLSGQPLKHTRFSQQGLARVSLSSSASFLLIPRHDGTGQLFQPESGPE